MENKEKEIYGSRQVPKVNNICANKKYYDILYSYLQCISEPEYEYYYSEKEKKQKKRVKFRYLNKKDINFSKLGEIFNLSRQTVSTKFKNLKDLGLIIDKDKNTYELATLEKEIAFLVPYETLKVLSDALNENSISTYIYLFNEFFRHDEKPYQFTLDQIKAFIGISTNTRSNNDIVVNILYILQKIGLIRYSLTTFKQENDNFENIKTIYQLDWITDTLVK